MPTFREAARFWVWLGCVNFGGPAGQIALMHRELVERRRWVSEELFLRALNFCMLLPGPEAQQLATYIGWRLHGVRGGLVAGAFFVIPSIFVLLFLSWLAVAHHRSPVVRGLFYGIQPVVVAIVAQAVLRIGKRALRRPALYLFAAAAFVALYFFSVPFPLIILAAALAGLLLERSWPQVFRGNAVPAEVTAVDGCPAHAQPSFGRLVRVTLVFVLLWTLPVGSLWWARGTDDVVTQEAFFFTTAAFVTFGGAYAVLSYVADVCVRDYRWLDAAQMVQGLGLAESTPGPLIMVTQYVGFLGAWHHAGARDPLANGLLGALVTTYVTFLPCFFFIFAGAPYIERLTTNPRLQAALTSVTAAVVGVILHLAVFFATRVLLHPVRRFVPLPEGRVHIMELPFDPLACLLAAASFVALLRFKAPVQWVVLAGAILGFLLRGWWVRA